MILGVVASAFFFFAFFKNFISSTFRNILALSDILLHQLTVRCNSRCYFPQSSYHYWYYIHLFHSPYPCNLIFKLVMRESNGHDVLISWHFIFLINASMSGLLCSKRLSVCMGKLYRILQSSDLSTFSGLCMFHFLLLEIPTSDTASNG